MLNRRLCPVRCLRNILRIQRLLRSSLGIHHSEAILKPKEAITEMKSDNRQKGLYIMFPQASQMTPIFILGSGLALATYNSWAQTHFFNKDKINCWWKCALGRLIFAIFLYTGKCKQVPHLQTLQRKQALSNVSDYFNAKFFVTWSKQY